MSNGERGCFSCGGSGVCFEIFFFRWVLFNLREIIFLDLVIVVDLCLWRFGDCEEELFIVVEFFFCSMGEFDIGFFVFFIFVFDCINLVVVDLCFLVDVGGVGFNIFFLFCLL